MANYFLTIVLRMSISSILFLGSATAQDSIFNGVITVEIYNLPYSKVHTIDPTITNEVSLQPYHTGSTLTYHVCGDTIFSEERSVKNSDVYRKHQYRNSSLILNIEDSTFFRVKNLRSFEYGVTANDWKPYRKKLSKNPLGFNYRLIYPFMQEAVTLAKIDETVIYRQQRDYGGRFEVAFNPRGVYSITVLEQDTFYIVQQYTYSNPANHSCGEFFEGIEVKQDIGEFGSQEIDYAPDTIPNFDGDFGKMNVGEVYDTSGAIMPDITIPEAVYTIVEFYTDECTGCVKKLPYLDSIRSLLATSQLGIISIYVTNNQDIYQWKDLLDSRPKRWSNYMALAPVNSYLYGAFNFRILPRYVIVDAEGMIVLPYSPWPGDRRLLDILTQLYPELKE